MLKRLAGCSLALCLLAPRAWAGPDSVVRMSVAACDPNNPANCQISNNLTPLGYQQVAVLSSATSLTVPHGATVAYVQAELQGVRWRDDGAAPTNSVGMPLQATAVQVFTGAKELAALQFIQASPGAVLDVTYYK